MGFFGSLLKGMAEAAVESAGNALSAAKEAKHLQGNYAGRSQEQLKNDYNNASSLAEKMAIAKQWKENKENN